MSKRRPFLHNLLLLTIELLFHGNLNKAQWFPIVPDPFQPPPIEHRWRMSIAANNSTIRIRPPPSSIVPLEDETAMKDEKLSSSDQQPRKVLHSNLADSIDESVDPCDDFYSYVCNGWIDSHQIGPFETRVSQFELIIERVRGQIKELINGRNLASDYQHNFFYVYDACMNGTERSLHKTEPLLEILQGLRISLKKTDPVDELTDWMIAANPVMLWYSVSVEPDIMNTSRNFIQVTPIGTFLPKEYYLNPKRHAGFLAAFKQLLADILAILINDDDNDVKNNSYFTNGTNEIASRVAAFMQIEKRLAQVLNDTDRFRDDIKASYNLVSLHDLQNYSKSINWTKYLSAIIPQSIQNVTSIGTMRFLIDDLQTFQDYEQVLVELMQEQMILYRDWKVILMLTDFLDDRFEQAKQLFDLATFGVPERTPRQLQCQSHAMNMFPDLISRAFILSNFDRDSHSELTKIVDAVRRSFQAILMEADWMDDHTKLEAIAKLSAMGQIIGFSRNLFNESRQTRRFASLHLNSSMHLVTMIRTIGQWNQRLNFERLMQINTRNDLEFLVTDVNAFYDQQHNQIALLAGITQGAFFNVAMPRPINYGAIGVVIAHEITHAFDDGGRQYDIDGNLFNWWDNATERSFILKKQCLIDQYGAIEVPNTDGMTIDGIRTQGENIADNGGIRAAFRALMSNLEQDTINQSSQQHIAGLESRTPEQLFFISHAFTWCSKHRPEATADRLLNDAHTPDEFRVNLALSNQPEFARAFKCPRGSPMNPERKCTVW